MTNNKITSFFQVAKSSKRGKPSHDTSSGEVKETPGIPRQRGLVSTGTDNNADAASGTSVQNEGVHATTTTATAAKRLKVSSECHEEVQQLLMHLNDSSAHGASGKSDCSTATSWKMALQHHLDSTSFRTLSKFVATERNKYTIYPPTQYIWSALNLCPLHHVKVVIVGQDPYHGPGQAHGLSFSVRPGCPIPPSLKNMYASKMDIIAVIVQGVTFHL